MFKHCLLNRCIDPNWWIGRSWILFQGRKQFVKINLPATSGTTGAADWIRAGRSASGTRTRTSAWGNRSSFWGMGGFGGLSRGPLWRRVPWLRGMRRSTPAMMVSPINAPPPVITVRIPPCGTRQSEGITNSRLEMRLRGFKTATNRTNCRAGPDSRGKNGTVSVIVRVVVPRPIESATAFMVSVRTVLVCAIPTVWTAARGTERDGKGKKRFKIN